MQFSKIVIENIKSKTSLFPFKIKLPLVSQHQRQLFTNNNNNLYCTILAIWAIGSELAIFTT